MANRLKKQEELHQIYLAGYKEHPLTLKPKEADLLKRAKNQPGCRGKLVLIHGFTQKIPDFQLILQAAQKENLSVNLTTTGKTSGNFKEYVFEIDDEKLVSGYFANEKVARDVLSLKARQLLEENCFSIIVKCNKRGRTIRRSDIINPYLIENYSRGTRAFNNPSPDALADLKNNLTKIFTSYINSPESDALIFDTSFSEKERKSFGPLAEKLNLRFNHYGKQAGRVLVISKAYLSWDLVEHMLANGDETLTFKLIRPQRTVDSLPECKILPMPSRAETKAGNNRRSTENSPPAKKARMDEDNQNKDVNEKSTAETNTKESDTTKPKTTESNITASTITESKTTESNITASTITESKTTESNITASTITQSKTTESKTIQSKTKESKTAEPNKTETNTTAPNRTEPNTTEPNTTEPNTTEPNTTEPNTTESNTKKGADSGEKYDLDTFMEELEKCSKQEDKFAPDKDINKDTDAETLKEKEGGEESIQNEVKSEVSQHNSVKNKEDSKKEDGNETGKEADTNTEGDEQNKGTDAHENDKTSQQVTEPKEADKANESKEAATDKPSFWESDLCFSNFEDNSLLPQEKDAKQDEEKADENKEQTPESDSTQDTKTRAEKLLARRLKNRQKIRARKLKKRLESQNLKDADIPRGIPIGKKAGPKGGTIQKGGRAMNKDIEDRLYSKVKPRRRSPDRRSSINQIPSLFEVDVTRPPAGSSHGYGGYDDPMEIPWGLNNKAARRKHARELKKQKYRDDLEERRGYKHPLPGLSTFAQEFLHRVRSQVGCRGRIVLYHEYSKTTPAPNAVLQTSVNKIGMHITTKPTGEIRGTNFGYALYIGKEEMLRDYFGDEKKAHNTLVPRVYDLLKETCFSVMVKTDKDGQLIRRKDLAISRSKGRQHGNWNTRNEELTLNVNQVFEDYIRSPHSYNLIFDTDFSYNEKSYFSRISQTYKLKHRFHGNKAASVLLVWKPLNLWDLVEHLLANGGETPSYRLVLPTRYV